MSPHPLDPTTVEYCERCRYKTRHTVNPRTGERECDEHQAREPGCQCHWEVGDSPCSVHGADEEVGA
ncbi:MAG: hypothetical protein RL685_5158 [Pseudomonadota bacterium]|jgi:hypothetical protein